jgi:hypothetical protein
VNGVINWDEPTVVVTAVLFLVCPVLFKTCQVSAQPRRNC